MMGLPMALAKKGATALAGASLLAAPEEAEATPFRIITAGGDAAGALFKRLMRAQQDGLTPSSAMKQAMHDKTFSTYNDMIREATKRDGGPAGAFYKAQIKDLIGPIAKDPRFNKSKYAQEALRDWTLQRLKRGPDYKPGGPPNQRGSVDPTMLLPIAGIGGAAAMMTPMESEAALVDDRTKKESLFDLSGLSWLANPAIRSVAGSLFDLEQERSERPVKALYSAGEAAYQSATEGEDFGDEFEETWDDMSLSEIIDTWGERSPALGAGAKVGSMLLGG